MQTKGWVERHQGTQLGAVSTSLKSKWGGILVQNCYPQRINTLTSTEDPIPVHTTVCCSWSFPCDTSCQVQDLNWICSRSMSQRHKLGVHWELTARRGPEMGQGAVLQHGHAPATERSGWSWLKGLNTQGRPGWDRGEGWEWRAPRWLHARGSTHIHNNLGDNALLFLCDWCQEQGTIYQRCVGRWDVKALAWGRGGTFLMLTKCSVTRKGGKEQQWNGDVCDRGMAPTYWHSGDGQRGIWWHHAQLDCSKLLPV